VVVRFGIGKVKGFQDAVKLTMTQVTEACMPQRRVMGCQEVAVRVRKLLFVEEARIG
jgi:hypothetical protein